MGICTKELLDLVIYPTLAQLEPNLSEAELKSAATLLLATAAVESGPDFPIHEQTKGYGIYQIDKLDHLAVWDNFLAFDADMASKVRGFASQHSFLSHPNMELATNLSYATAIAWNLYKKAGLPVKKLDASLSVYELADYWYHFFPGIKDDNAKGRFISAYFAQSVNRTQQAA